jgi:hypothetical protein
MDKKGLKQLYYLNKEIEQDEELIRRVEAAATSTTSKIDGLPHAAAISDKTALMGDVADLKASIERKRVQTLYEYNKILDYVNTIDDSLIRQIVKFRHMYGLSWAAVARRVGGGNSADNIRMIYNRFFEKK